MFGFLFALDEFFVRGERLAQLGECEGHGRRKLEPPEVVAICNHLVTLGAAER